MTQTGNKIIMSQKTAWSAGITKAREDRYKHNFWKKNDAIYIKKHTPEEIARRVREHDNCEVKSNFFWSEDTGPITNFHGKPPLRMLIDNERVGTSSRFKKFLYVFLQEMEYSTWYEKIGIALSIRKLRNIYLESVYRGVADYLIDPRYITPPVREIRRCMEKVFPGNGKYEWEGYYSDPPCFFLEYDPAYRYRLQDILSEANKENAVMTGNRITSIIGLILWVITKRERFLFKGAREARRLAQVLLDREINMGGNWGKIKEMATLAVQVSPWLRRKFCEFIQELDIEKIRLNQYDIYWSYQNLEYNYGGLSKPLRDKIVKNYDDIRNH
jgi:hypothetical protein